MSPSILIIGYGNPGRLDDGLGPAFAKAVEEWNIPGITVDSAYQLSVEDSHAVARHDLVIFADATVGETDSFYFRKLKPETEINHTTHHLDPASVFGLARKLFDTKCEAYELGIRGYAFNDFGEHFSTGAEENLAASLTFIRQLLQDDYGLYPMKFEPTTL
jgi:hydrogenase maturation protease